MSTTFTASSGVKIEPNPLGIVIHSGTGHKYPMYTEEVAALREFLQHERDEELGRWRSKLHPEWVGYYNGPNAGVLIDERGGVVHDIARGHVFPNDALVTALSDEYFAAHSEPWHSSKNGEIWALRLENAENFLPYRWHAGESAWFNSNTNMAMHRSDEQKIVAARRIWPEPSDG